MLNIYPTKEDIYPTPEHLPYARDFSGGTLYPETEIKPDPWRLNVFRPVSYLKDTAEDADENYVVYVCKPVPGKPVSPLNPDPQSRAPCCAPSRDCSACVTGVPRS